MDVEKLDLWTVVDPVQGCQIGISSYVVPRPKTATEVATEAAAEAATEALAEVAARFNWNRRDGNSYDFCSVLDSKIIWQPWNFRNIYFQDSLELRNIYIQDSLEVCLETELAAK